MIERLADLTAQEDHHHAASAWLAGLMQCWQQALRQEQGLEARAHCRSLRCS